ncbi:MAG: hypothetical protein QNJ71_09005 [Acidimicrobiia bacterium]|nr:hypothetical protein [Acidimicrobiia bacterium]
MWIVIGLIVGVIAVVALILVVWRASRRDEAEATAMTGDELFTLGVVFTGAGVALFVSIGPAMLGMFALGIVFMVVGAKKRRSER